MNNVFNKENYESDLALVMLNILVKKEICGTRQYRQIRDRIVKESDVIGTNGSAYSSQSACEAKSSG